MYACTRYMYASTVLVSVYIMLQPCILPRVVRSRQYVCKITSRSTNLGFLYHNLWPCCFKMSKIEIHGILRHSYLYKFQVYYKVVFHVGCTILQNKVKITSSFELWRNRLYYQWIRIDKWQVYVVVKGIFCKITLEV